MMVPSMHCSADELSGLGQDNGQVQLEMHIGCVALPQSRQYPSPPIVFGDWHWHNFLVSALCETSVRILKDAALNSYPSTVVRRLAGFAIMKPAMQSCWIA